MKKHFWVNDGFSSNAKALRGVFAEKFENPRAARNDRFVWDFWHVPDQYTLVRTPAAAFFPQKLFRSFLGELGEWAQETLGCSALTPPWLSYYVEGCEQKLHSDVPHGPWAYVFSLSPQKQIFHGGETLILKPETLSYWQNFQDSQDREIKSFVDRIKPKFNRLVVFDPRFPHGVTPVSGTMDPREARLVIHGWFTDPKPYLEGALSARQVAPVLDETVNGFVNALAPYGRWHGILSLRIQVKKNGSAVLEKILADTLMPVGADPADERRVRAELLRAFAQLRFPAARGATAITLPLLFR
ncbi:MAG: 2OG-Fe(II) oxygenase [Bdellovibrionota bacterium]